MGPRFESVKVHHGPMVKWLRQRPLTPLTWVRIPLGSPRKKALDKREKRSIIKEVSGETREWKIVGVDCDEGPPVPIPNTEVKLICADNTCRVTGREDR